MSPKKAYKAPDIDTSQDNLVIVESPAKARTIKKYLGDGFEVTASMGHIADLPKKGMAIDIDNEFAPTYEISSDKKKIISGLKQAVKKMSRVRLATDEDREGEAIARHICQALDLDVDETPRIVFHEITQDAIQQAIANPKRLDLDLVDAQQARRVLDRLVGFELSPVLRKKVKPSLSAGRVQSVAVRILVEREREILSFDPKQTYKVSSQFLTSSDESLEAELSDSIQEAKEVESFLQHCSEANFEVDTVTQNPGKKNPRAPFTTSTLQQAASQKLGFSVSKTMQLAQRLYESGYITYMRTDSLNLSKYALASTASEIEKRFGKKYVKVRTYATKSKSAQEAHEAIRPTKMSAQDLGQDRDQKRLYRLIWQRTMASQMAPAQVEKTSILIAVSDSDYFFKTDGEVVTFPGFLKVYDDKPANKDDKLLPVVKPGEILKLDTLSAQAQFSKPPARYSEASLVKKLEQLGIGRPSTYAPTISTIQKRGYVVKNSSAGTPTQLQQAQLQQGKVTRSVSTKNIGVYKNRLLPTDMGMIVTDFLVEHFPDIMNYQFTAQVEEQFDTIATGNLKRQDMITTFYGPFHKQIEEVTEHAERASGERVLGSDPKTGKVVKVRIGKYGPLVQIGEQDDPDKQFASLRGSQRIETITLDEALQAFKLPRKLGSRNKKELKASIGRFGPYVQRGDTFASIKSPDDPYSIEKERAVELIKEKIKKDKEREIKSFTLEGKDGVVMKGRRGPIIKWNRKRVKLPKGTDGAKISLKEIKELLDDANKKTKTRKKSSKKTKTKKKSQRRSSSTSKKKRNTKTSNKQRKKST